MIRRQLRDNVRWIIVIAVLCAGAALSIGYILSQQNLTFPWENRYVIHAEFATTAGLEPGLGQPVNVAGVRVGTIRDVRLKDGRAVADLEIDPDLLPHVFRDAHAMLIPTSALKDLRIDIVPGHAAAGRLREGATIPIARTAPPIDADELLSALDGDTRSFRAVLLGESGRATAGRGNDLRALLRAVGPTAAQLRGVARTLARRNREVRRLVTNLAAISRTVGPRDADLGRVVQGAAATVEAVAGQQRSLDRALQQLPGTLRTVSGTLAQIPSFGDEASASLRALRPAIERLPGALDAAAPLAREAGPIVRTQLRPAVRELQPLARDLHALTPDLSRVTPSLTSAFRVLTYTVDELAFNPRGDDEGFLYWVAWSAHNLNSVVSGGDAHGAFIRAIALIDCDSLTGSPLLVGLGVQAVLGGVVPTCPKARP